ncbi:uncharacterized protein VP01_5881g1 [Puccinia sorghi]|uniref:Retrotransposon gag domain-containing protein n=1 Tax=Puccinia sorghi TaxID=27349 RepID=A0A0L6UHZ6_9BASI|nr:uncharacterized protein VP01_5881g1 [Puccinia sorghi]
MGEERAQKIATEETLQQNQARLDATDGQHNPSPAQPNPPAPTFNPMVIAKTQPFDGARGAASKVFIGQIGLHAVTYPKRFPNNVRKVVFAVLFMRDYTENWSQPYLDKVFNEEPVVFDNFLNNFRSSFFDCNRQHRAKLALRNLRQTGTMSAYMQDFNQHTRTVGWANTPLMSPHQHSLKENIQLAVVMSNIEFDSPVNASVGPEGGSDN